MSNLLPSLEIELILSKIIKKSREWIIAHSPIRLTPKQQKIFQKNLSRLKKQEPLAFILGEKEFFGLKFKVNKYTLIPRPETEILVEEALKKIKKNSSYSNKVNKIIIADIGTGSGNIIISLAHHFLKKEEKTKNLLFFGSDISSKALLVAKENTQRNLKKKKIIIFKKGNLLKPLEAFLKKQTKIIKNPSIKIILVSNLPYLSEKELAKASLSVRKFEPKKALFGKKNGFFYYQIFLEQLKKIKKQFPAFSFSVIWEISPTQKKISQKKISETFPYQKLKEISFKKDLSGKIRAVSFDLE